MSKQIPSEPEFSMIDFISDILEKMIDNQTFLSEKLATLEKNAEDASSQLSWISKQFTNGFRSELKNHITQEIKGLKTEDLSGVWTQLTEIDKALYNQNQELKKGLNIPISEVIREVRSYRRVGFWVKIISAMLVAAAGISFAAAKIANTMGSSGISTTNIQLLEKELVELKQSVKEMGHNTTTQPHAGISK